MSERLRGWQLRMALRELSEWSMSSAGHSLRGRWQLERSAALGFVLAGSVALAEHRGLPLGLSLEGARVSIRLVDPSIGGVSAACLELARELSKLVELARGEAIKTGVPGRPALRRPKLEPSASGPEETG